MNSASKVSEHRDAPFPFSRANLTTIATIATIATILMLREFLALIELKPTIPNSKS
jgi:hypothetical protein